MYCIYCGLSEYCLLMMLLCSGIVPIPAVAASFSRESLNTSSEVRQEVTSSLARSASLTSRQSSMAVVMSGARSGEQISVTTCPLESAENSAILTRSTCSLHSDTHTTPSQSLSLHSRGKSIINKTNRSRHRYIGFNSFI